MNAPRLSLFPVFCLLLTPSAFAADSVGSLSWNAKPDADHYARRCQARTSERGLAPVGTLLWGTKRAWDGGQKTDERRSVLVSIDSEHLLQANAHVKAVRLLEGRLVTSPDETRGLVGTVFQGTSGDGRPVEVAICGAEPAPSDPEVMWYRIEAWNPGAREWENPCISNGYVPDPRAMVVQGLWTTRGDHQDAPGRLTLACELGAISKCINWGYKPWEVRQGRSLADLHQACTRMARADYCGDGRSHTPEYTTIDMYDALGVLSRTAKSSASWDLSRASFEAAWAPDGATCLARTRDGRSVASILAECPGRFHVARAVDLGAGDHCTVQREGLSADAVLLRNHSYEQL
ncbi:ADYC domain-containing protein [Pyxidicoccus sp. MSG2]|uniref:ADYC domain-containing protein n=1 Tax=Pyxidicoccus sp. MSG2 TaxID=2996790 RepID=UPI00226F4F46|nr:ADYC domain-containing protein [Pyxidicoccus sp. MSG2]MCY1019473.1 ADYC domain-containing protein [Pyxidicoccus sp. MSG2]